MCTENVSVSFKWKSHSADLCDNIARNKCNNLFLAKYIYQEVSYLYVEKSELAIKKINFLKLPNHQISQGSLK